jgi:hypothetical protein
VLLANTVLPTELMANNTHFPLAKEATYLHRRNRKKVHRGRPVPWFERYQAGGIAKVHRYMAEDKLRPVK